MGKSYGWDFFWPFCLWRELIHFRDSISLRRMNSPSRSFDIFPKSQLKLLSTCLFVHRTSREMDSIKTDKYLLYRNKCFLFRVDPQLHERKTFLTENASIAKVSILRKIHNKHLRGRCRPNGIGLLFSSLSRMRRGLKKFKLFCIYISSKFIRLSLIFYFICIL